MEHWEGQGAASVELSRRIVRAFERREVAQFLTKEFLTRSVIRSAPQHVDHEEQQFDAARALSEFARPVVSGKSLPSNISQITDHVINQLDRRMLAWRERMGKV